MIDYVKASKSIGKIFKGEIFGLIAKLLVIISAVGGYVLLNTSTVVDEVATGSTAAIVGVSATIVFYIAIAVFGIIAIIFQLTGVLGASKYNSNFKTALYFYILSFLLMIASECITSISGAAIWTSIASTVHTVVSIVVTIFIISGCQELLMQNGNTELAEKASLVQTRVIIAFVLTAIFQFIPTFTTDLFDTIFGIAAAICMIIAYIQYLGILRQTRKALAAKQA